jgi:hypothetical protein
MCLHAPFKAFKPFVHPLVWDGSKPYHGNTAGPCSHTLLSPQPWPGWAHSSTYHTMSCQISGAPNYALPNQWYTKQGRRIAPWQKACRQPHGCKSNQITIEGHAASSVGVHYCQLHTKAKPVLPTIDYQRNMNVGREHSRLEFRETAKDLKRMLILNVFPHRNSYSP